MVVVVGVWGVLRVWVEEEEAGFVRSDFTRGNVQTMWAIATSTRHYTTLQTLLPSHRIRIHIKQVVCGQLLVLVAREIRLNHRLPREPERLKLHVHQHPFFPHRSQLTRSIAACSSGVTFTTCTPPSPPSSPPSPNMFSSCSGLFASVCAS
jgi:hypothetical protein